MANVATVKLLREVPSILHPVTLTKHEKRLEVVVGREFVDRLSLQTQDEDTLRWLREVKKAGFHSIVTVDWALKFKHHASVIGHNVCEDLSMREDHGLSWYYYRGDIPEFALDALELFKEASRKGRHRICNADVSVHSMMPLPMRIERAIPSVDPVMIGWEESPQFTLGLSGWGAGRGYYLGVIISVWDEFKEMVDYKVEVSDLTLQ